jgi:hypothetical protein
MDEISKLTVRQIYFLYLAERNKEGQRKAMPYYFKDEATNRAHKIAQFRTFGKSLGKTDEEIQHLIDEAIKNGTI